MHVGVFSYAVGHRKTVDVLRRMMYRHDRITVYAFPFTYKPTKSRTERWQERPWQLMDFDPAAWMRAQGIGYVEVRSWGPEAAADLGAIGHPDTPDVYVTCIGAKIIPGHFLEGRKVLNCHPALLPQNRGLDAFKWGILKGWPFGATLFIMDEVLDRGQMLFRTRVPVLPCDTLDNVAGRTYDMECHLTAEFDRHLAHEKEDWILRDADGPLSTKLIPKAEDDRLAQTFLAKRDMFMNLSVDIGQHTHPADAFGDARRLAPRSA